MLAGTYRSGRGNDLLRRRISTHAVPSPKHGKRAQRMKCIAETTEHFPTQRQAGAGGGFESVLQRV